MSDLITADLVLLDENLGETRFDVIAKLAQAVLRFRTAVAPPSPSRPWPWHAPTRQFPSVQRTAPPT